MGIFFASHALLSKFCQPRPFERKRPSQMLHARSATELENSSMVFHQRWFKATGLVLPLLNSLYKYSFFLTNNFPSRLSSILWLLKEFKSLKKIIFYFHLEALALGILTVYYPVQILREFHILIWATVNSIPDWCFKIWARIS